MKIIFFLENLCALFGGIIFTIIILQIIFRVFFKIPLAWVSGLVQILVVYYLFVGASVLVLRDKIAKVVIVTSRAPIKIKGLLLSLIKVLTIFMGISLLYGSITYWELLKMYRLAILPITAEIFIFPVFFFSLTLIFKDIIRFFYKDNGIKYVETNLGKKSKNIIR